MPIEGLALHTSQSAGQFTRYSFETEMGASFMRDPRTLRLKLRLSDVDAGKDGGQMPPLDMSRLGGRDGLARYAPGRFHDLDLMVARLMYVFPLARLVEADLHTEWGAVYSDVWNDAQPNTLREFVRLQRARPQRRRPHGELGVDFSPDGVRVSYTFERCNERRDDHPGTARVVGELRPRSRPGRPLPPTRSRPPRNISYSYAYDILDNDLVRPVTRMLDVAWIARKISAHPREAANVDDRDQVRLPSTWRQPRIGFRAVTPEQMLAGLGTRHGARPRPLGSLAQQGSGRDAGIPGEGFEGEQVPHQVRRPGFPDLATSAEVIGSRVFWAAGYNVPDDAITYFRAEDLDIAADATYTDAHGHKYPMTQAYLQHLLSRVERQSDGRYRCNASLYLEGKPLGPIRIPRAETRRPRRPDPT